MSIKNPLDSILNKNCSTGCPEDNIDLSSGNSLIEIPASKCSPPQKVIINYGSGGITEFGSIIEGDNINITGNLTDRLVGDGDIVIEAIIPPVDLSNYYTKTELQTSGQSEVHWDNLTNIPDLSVTWENITGDQSVIGNAGFTNDAGYITLGDIPAPDYSTLPGFGLSWNPSTQKLDWGNTIDIGGGNFAHQVIIPDGDIFTIFSGIGTGGQLLITSAGAGMVSGSNNLTVDATKTVSTNVVKYLFDVSANYDNRSLVDKEYVDNLIPDLTGYATESWVQSQGYITNVTSSWDVNTGNLTIQGGVHNLDGRYMLRSNTLTAGYGITASSDFMNPVSIELNTGVIDDRYLRKDQDDDNSTNNLTLGSLLTLGDAEVGGDLILPNLSRGDVDDQVLLRNPLDNTVRYLSIGNIQTSFNVANSAGVSQFVVEAGDFLRFNATGDATVAFNSTTKTITINSTGGSSGGGGVSSWNARTGDVVPEVGDYTTTLVSEGTNQYFTEARVRNTVLTGFSATNSSITASDNILQAFNKAQGQISARALSSRTITINGTAGNITVSGGTQNLTANRSWTINLPNVGTAGTYTKVTTDSQGRVVGSAALTINDLPSAVVQNLSLGANPGSVNISGGSGVNLVDLGVISKQDANTRSLASVFQPYRTIAGMVNYPTTSVGTGFRIERYSTASSQSGMEFYTNGTTSGGFSNIFYRVFSSTSTYSGWETIASRGWVTSQIPTIPTNYVTTNSNQTGISGNKTWTGVHTWDLSTNTSPSGNLIVGIGRAAAGNYLMGRSSTGQQNFALRTYATNGVQLVLNEGGLDGPQGTNSTNAPILFAGGNPLLGRSTAGALSLMAWNSNLILKPNGTSTDGQVTIGTSGQVTISGLSGTGTQMVVANASGVLSRQAIPVGDITGVTAGTGLSGGGASGTVTLNIAAAYSPNTSTSLGTADLNATTTPGFYHQTSNANATSARNYPATSAGNLQVYRDAGITQRYNVYNTGATYVRNYYSSSWTAWVRVDYRSHSHTWESLTGTIGTIPGAGSSTTYGSLNVSGSKSSYSGINFADAGNSLFMVHNTNARSGLYKGSWVWAFEGDGTLYAGTVPWARLTGVPSYVPTSRTITAGNGLTGGGNLTANRTLTVGAGAGITVNASDVAITNIAAGSSTSGALRYNGTTRSAGRLYGGTTNPTSTTRLNYDGILHAYDFIGYGSSDERLKDHITPIIDPIGKLSQLGGYSFKWKPGHDSYQGNDYGLIAQEVEKVLPEIVVERGGVKAIKTGNQLIGLLVSGFNELSKRVEALENGIS